MSSVVLRVVTCNLRLTSYSKLKEVCIVYSVILCEDSDVKCKNEIVNLLYLNLEGLSIYCTATATVPQVLRVVDVCVLYHMYTTGTHDILLVLVRTVLLLLYFYVHESTPHPAAPTGQADDGEVTLFATTS